MKIRHIKDSGTLIVDNIKKYFEIEKQQFLKILFDIDKKIEWVDENQKADICVYSVQLEDESKLRSNEKNIFFSVENMKHWSWRCHYKFFNKYGWNGSKKTNIYIMNDVSKIIENKNHIIFPMVYFRIDYFNRIKSNYDFNIPWEKKKFCLFISQNPLNKNKKEITNKMRNLGEVNHINQLKPLLHDKSCYNDVILLKCLNNFKFIICCENSKTQGYVTEKIFNIILAKSIPIYDGAPDINRYINKERYLKLDSELENNVKRLMNNEDEYNKFINKEAINSNLDMENFKEIYIKYLKNQQ